MLETINAFFGSPGFIFFAGILLLGAFFWYLSSESDRIMRIAGSVFILGLATFSLVSLVNNGIKYGIDISGGAELTLEVQPKVDDTTGDVVPPSTADMEQAVDILNERLNATGTSEVQIIYSGNKILIQIPQLDKDPEKNKEQLDAMVRMLTKLVRLDLLPVHPDNDSIVNSPEVIELIEKYEVSKAAYLAKVKENPDAALQLRAPLPPILPMSMNLTEYRLLEHPVLDEETHEPKLDKAGNPVIDYMVVLKPFAAQQHETSITGKDIVAASPDGQRRGVVNVVLSNEGARKMTRLTSSMRKGLDSLAVVLDNTVKSAPRVQDTLGKQFEISGLTAPGEAEDICKALANPLSNDLKVEGRKDVSAQLGKSALDQGQFAGLIGVIAIFFFCFWFYRLAGMVAMVGLTINMLILLGLMSLFGFVLTLPGIAGIVLTMGVAVDANVLIYERMREERAQGRGFLVALRNAYEKAFSAIFDSNVTSLLTAVILFALASGSIKGFAVTTSVGIVTSLIGAIVVTRVLFFWSEHTGMLKDTKFSRAPFEGKRFDFLKWRKVAAIGSSIFIVASLVYAFTVRQDKALGIDFTGGSTITYAIPADSTVDYDAVDKYVNTQIKLSKKPTVQEFGTGDDRSIKIRCASPQEATVIDEMLRKNVAGMKDISIPSVDNVSSSLGATFFQTALLAIGVGLVGITIYLAIRFEWSFSMGALVAIGHDLLFIIGLVVLLGTELSIIHIGAFLTVAGYSINDTIVIYDRIREAIRLAEPDESMASIMNRAINDTLPRTTLTSLSTIAVLVALIAFGGPAMYDFSVTMLFGVIFGTYSSVFIAAPVVLLFSRRHSLKDEVLKADQLIGEEHVSGKDSV